MAAARHLKNPPIVEAVLDIRVKRSGTFQPDWLLELEQAVRGRYPIAERRSAGEKLIKLFLGGQASLLPTHKDRETLYGVVCKTEDRLSAVQFRLDGFSVNRLEPYTSWEGLLNEAKDFWPRYAESTTPEMVTRLSARYINRFISSRPIEEIGRDLTTPPQFSDPQINKLAALTASFVVHDSDHDLDATVTQSIERSQDNRNTRVTIDIDAHASTNFNPEDKGIWAKSEALHQLAQRLFFDTITEEAARSFD